MSFWDVFFEDGNINTIIGRPKMGKTNVTVDMAFNAIEQGYTVLSNIIFFKPWNVQKAIDKGWLNNKIDYKEIPKKFKYIPLASKLVLEATATEKNIVIIDEAGTSASAYKALSNTSVQMRYLGYNIRKIGGCLIIIAQAKRSVVPDLREELVNFEVHLKRDDHDVRSLNILKRHEYYNSEKKEYDIEFLPYDDPMGIPLASIPYDTKSTAGFIWDVNLYDIFYEIILQGYDAFEARENLPSIINNLIDEKKIEEFMKKKKFMKTGSVALMLDKSDRTIQNWADAGRLKCIKDAGGSRLFSIADVRKFARKEGFPILSGS